MKGLEYKALFKRNFFFSGGNKGSWENTLKNAARGW